MNTQTKQQKRTRGVQLIVRVTPEEKELIMEKVKQSGLNFNLYALVMLRGGEVNNIDLTHYRELAKEVGRVGTNINQIAASVNTHGQIRYEEQITELQSRMEEIWQLLKSNLSGLQSKKL